MSLPKAKLIRPIKSAAVNVEVAISSSAMCSR